MKAVLFDIEDTLYDTSLQMRMTRLNAVRAMIGAGLPIDLETGYKTLEEIVNQYGPHYTKHFDRLLERLGLKWDPAVIAAGVVAYRETSDAYLKPFPDTVPTLIRLRDMGLFHSVVISEEQGTEDFNVELFMKCMDELGVKPGETVYLSSKPNKGILYANKAGIVTVRVRRGDSTLEEPESEEAKARFEIERLSEIFDVLKNIEKSSSTQ